MLFNLVKLSIIILFYISIVYVSAESFPASYINQQNNTILNSLVRKDQDFPSCSMTDYYWYQKYGADQVEDAVVGYNDVVLQADTIVGKSGVDQIAQGEVSLQKEDSILLADWIDYNQVSNHVSGGDHVILTKQYNTIKGAWIDYYIDLNKGTILDAEVYNEKDTINIKGDVVTLLNKKQLQVKNGFMTSCDMNNPSWHFTSDLTNFDYQDGQGRARNANFYIHNTPVLSIPYFQFPLGERRSGFLTPEFGVINNQFVGGQYNSGIFAGVPYYWNMGPNYDMTIEPKFYSTDGLMISDQFRYVNKNGGGIWYTEQVPQDIAIGQYRYYYHLTDNHEIYKNLNVGFDFNRVSDNNYFVNFGNFNSATNNIDLNQIFYSTYNPQWGMVGLRVQNFQVLQPVGQPQVLPIYAMTPQFTFNLNPFPLNSSSQGLSLDLHSQYANFTSGALQNGTRSVIYPSLTDPIVSQWGFIKPKFGWNYTNYQLSPFPGIQNSYSNVDRNLPITSLDTGLVFDRSMSLFDKSFSQTLEPRLYYLYIPVANQSNLPVFDTAPATYNINQLFSENRFIGDDRINFANDLTFGVNSKLIDDNNGVEFANYGVGYRYFLTQQNPFFYGSASQQAQLFLPQPNLISELNNRWSDTMSTNLNYQYSTVYNTVDAYNIQFKYSPEQHKIINARFGYQFNLPLLYYAYTPGQSFLPVAYENQYALDISGQWPIYQDKIFIEGRTNYDFTYGTLLNFVGGLEYNGGCWGVKGVYENYLTNVNQLNTAFYIQFELKGVASFGNGDPTGDLKVNIPNYVPLQNTPGFPAMTSIH